MQTVFCSPWEVIGEAFIIIEKRISFVSVAGF